jgi:hypothetical protein
MGRAVLPWNVVKTPVEEETPAALPLATND